MGVSAALDAERRRKDAHVLASGALGAARGQRSCWRPSRNSVSLTGKGRAKAKRLTGRDDQRDFFEAEASVGVAAVRVDRVRLERGRAFGGVWLGGTL